MPHNTVREWPKGVTSPGTTKAFVAAYRKAFDADPGATFCAGELDGLTLVVAVGERARELQEFVRTEWHGVIQRRTEIR